MEIYIRICAEFLKTAIRYSLMTPSRQHGRCPEEHGKIKICTENGGEHTYKF
jgi:hypothetical protein